MKKTIILAALFAASSASFAATTDTLWITTYSGVDNSLNEGSDSVSSAVLNNALNTEFVPQLQAVSNGIVRLSQETSNGVNAINEGNRIGVNVRQSRDIIAGLSGAVGQGSTTGINYTYNVTIADLAEDQKMSITAVKVQWVVFDNEGNFLGTTTNTSTPFDVSFGVAFTDGLSINLSQQGTIAGALNGSTPETIISGQNGPMVANVTNAMLGNGETSFKFSTSVTGLVDDPAEYNNLYVGLKSVEFLGEIVEVPEPATASLGILGLGALMLRRRRR